MNNNSKVIIFYILVVITIYYVYATVNNIYTSLKNGNEEYYDLLIFTIKIVSYIYNILIPEIQAENNHIPKIIWQTYKTKNIPLELQNMQNSWINKNPEWDIKLYDDNDIEKYIIEYWDNRMLNFYKNLTIGAMKADLFRYLILTTYGGIYTDLDTICNRSINSWVYDYNLQDKKDILLISLEYSGNSYCQWTILSTPNHPAMKHVCQYILLNFEKNGIDTSKPGFVFNTTGPSIWSDAIKNYLGLDNLSVDETYDYYLNNKENIENKGIYIMPFHMYSMIYLINIVASSTVPNNYNSWRVHERKIINTTNVSIA